MNRGRGRARGGLSSFLGMVHEGGQQAGAVGGPGSGSQGGGDGIQEVASGIAQIPTGAGPGSECSSDDTVLAVPPASASSQGEERDDDSRSVTSVATTMSTAASLRKEPVGTEQEVVTNYFLMSKRATFTLYGYRVDFFPEEDNTRRKRKLVDQHKETLGNFMFDGHTLYSATYFEPQSLVSTDQGEEFEVKMRKVSEIKPDNPVYQQFYNIVLRSMLEKMGLEQIGRHYYDRFKAIEIPEDRLTLWPGFITAVRHHERGMMLCAEVTHKVLRKETAQDVMLSIWDQTRQQMRGKSEDEVTRVARERIKQCLNESIVITHYNRRTYRIDDIDFEVSPKTTFIKDGETEPISLREYYKSRWNVDIESDDQPLLVSFPRKKDRNKGITDKIFLIPELCFMTGLTDNMRKNFDLMKRLSVHLHMSPVDRKRRLDEFIAAFQRPEIKSELDKWNVEFSSEFVTATARVLKRENVTMGVNRGGVREHVVRTPDDSQDWTKHFRDAGLLEPKTVSRWIVFTPSTCKDEVNNLVQTLQRVGGSLGIDMAKQLACISYDPKQNFKHADFMREASKYAKDLDLVFYILPNNQLSRYAAVKRACTLELKTVSQCFQSKHLRSGGKLNSVAQKMLIQVHAKLRGEPWSVPFPAANLLVMGFDTYHCPDRKGESVGALVATINNNCTKYFSTVSFHKDKKELTSCLSDDVIKSLQAYKTANKALPKRIFLFRDGVGEGQVEYVRDQEVAEINKAIREFYSRENVKTDVQLCVVIVTKKINTRFLVQKGGRWISPVPGTVLDNTVTLPDRYEFFLVSQTVRQGTVSPTNYHVVYDTTGWPTGRLHTLAYKLCHLYFNWSGTVAVPAPCQYAHKLAYITGMALADQAPEELATNLWYL